MQLVPRDKEKEMTHEYIALVLICLVLFSTAYSVMHLSERADSLSERMDLLSQRQDSSSKRIDTVNQRIDLLRKHLGLDWDETILVPRNVRRE